MEWSAAMCALVRLRRLERNPTRCQLPLPRSLGRYVSRCSFFSDTSVGLANFACLDLLSLAESENKITDEARVSLEEEKLTKIARPRWTS